MLDRRANCVSVGRHKYVQPGINGWSSARRRNGNAGHITDTAGSSTAFTFVSNRTVLTVWRERDITRPCWLTCLR